MCSRNRLKLPEVEQHKATILPKGGEGGRSVAISFGCFPFCCFRHFNTYNYMPHGSKCHFGSLDFHASQGQILP